MTPKTPLIPFGVGFSLTDNSAEVCQRTPKHHAAGATVRHKHETVDDYIRDCPKIVVPLLNELRAFIHDTLPNATEGMQYGAPVFMNARGTPVIYLFGSKRHVNFGFLRSTELSDPNEVLKGSGKPSKHIKVFADKPFNKALLSDFINQCESLQA